MTQKRHVILWWKIKRERSQHMSHEKPQIKEDK